MKKIRVLFISPSLRSGGTEKIISYLYNNIDRNYFDPKLLVIGFESENHYQINGNNVVYLNKKRFRFSLFKIYANIMRGNHDIIFSSSFHINIFLSLMSFFLSKRKMIIRESSIFSGMKKYRKKSIIPFFILKFFYNNIDRIIFQSSDMEKDFVTLFKLKGNYQIINNPVTFKREALNKNNHYKYFNILNVGSLERLKGHERIISLLSNTKQNYRLTIYGSGSLEKELNMLIVKLNLVNRIKLKGLTKKIYSILPNYNFFIQGSYVEGFPNVLIEALSYGLPCLVFKAPGGHNDIIIEGFNGFFIEEGMKEQKILNKFFSFNWDRESIQKDCFERFNSKKIISQYEDLFIKIMK